MLALERLSPLERAAFLLHDVFGVGFEEVAETIDRSPPPAASSPAARADPCPRARPRFPVAKAAGPRDRRGILRGLAQRRHRRSARCWPPTYPPCRGGGKRPAATRPIVGFETCMQAAQALALLFRK